MHIETRGDLAVDRLQEVPEFDRAVTLMQRADDRAGGDVQRRIQARRAGALVVVGRALGRSEVEPDDVIDLAVAGTS
jgi:hypothetical protein